MVVDTIVLHKVLTALYSQITFHASCQMMIRPGHRHDVPGLFDQKFQLSTNAPGYPLVPARVPIAIVTNTCTPFIRGHMFGKLKDQLSSLCPSIGMNFRIQIAI